MIGLLSDARRALVGVWMIIVGRTGHEAQFELSGNGLARSFLGAGVLAAPLFIFILAAEAFLIDYLGEGQLTPPLVAAAIYFAMWAHFPLIAALVVRLLNQPGAFAGWVITHNWAVVFILALQTTPLLLFVVGVRDVNFIAALFITLQILAVLVHWRIASAALGAFGAPWHAIVAATCAHVFAWRLLQSALATLATAPPTPAV